MTCRHNKTWLLAGGRWEWCYACGAIRKLKLIEPNGCAPDGRWIKPTGPGGENPAMKVRKAHQPAAPRSRREEE